VHAAQGLTGDEPLERLEPEGELAQREGALAAQRALAQALEGLRRGVLRPVDDPQVLVPAALEGRLGEALAPPGEEVARRGGSRTAGSVRATSGSSIE